MGNIGAPELLIILGVLVLIFGSTQLPKLARSIGQAQKEFKHGLKDGASEDDDDEGKPSKGKSSK
ncbi:MAG: twin-arginine translocase TatA/TatE family subunit [Acidimicrobiia bacterium]